MERINKCFANQFHRNYSIVLTKLSNFYRFQRINFPISIIVDLLLNRAEKRFFFFERICVKLFQLRARFYFKESYSTNIDSTFTHPLQAMKVVLISGIVYHARRYAQFNKSTWFSVKITIQQLRIPYPRRMIKPTKCLATSNVSLSNMFRQYSENK